MYRDKFLSPENLNGSLALSFLTVWVALIPSDHLSAQIGKMRQWKSGKFSATAELVEFDEESITLRDVGGKSKTIKRELLSLADEDYLEALERRKDELPYGWVHPNFSEMEQVEIDLSAKEFWEVQVGGTKRVDPTPRGIATDYQPFTQKAGKVIVSPDQSTAIAQHDQHYIAMDLLDTNVMASSKDWIPVAGQLGSFSLSGKMFCLYSLRSKANGVIVYNFNWGKPEIIVAWNPYGSRISSRLDREVDCQFVGSKFVLTCNRRLGVTTLWSLKTAKALWWARTKQHCFPAVSADGKHVAIYMDNHLCLVDPRFGEIVAKKKVRIRGLEGFAFHPDGSRLAGIGSGNFIVWDCTNGKQLTEFSCPNSRFHHLQWLEDDYFLVGTGGGDSPILDIKNRCVVRSTIQQNDFSPFVAGVQLYMGRQASYRDSVFYEAIEFPPFAHTDNELPKVLFSSKIKVQIVSDLNFSGEQNKRIINSLVEQIQAAGATIVDDSKNKFYIRAGFGRPSSESNAKKRELIGSTGRPANYMSTGKVTVHGELLYTNGKQTVGLHMPHRYSLRHLKEPEKELPRYFEQFIIPAVITEPVVNVPKLESKRGKISRPESGIGR